VVLLAVALLAAATVYLVSGGRQPAGDDSTRTGWPGFEAEREGLIRELAGPVLACVGRVDERARGSAMFHGCGDWHNALAGHYALYTAYRRTGDVAYLRAAERQIGADKVPAELAFLPQLENPQNYRRYYGFPWLLRCCSSGTPRWPWPSSAGRPPAARSYARWPTRRWPGCGTG